MFQNVGSFVFLIFGSCLLLFFQLPQLPSSSPFLVPRALYTMVSACGSGTRFLFSEASEWKESSVDSSEPQESNHTKFISKETVNWPTVVTCCFLTSFSVCKNWGKKTECGAGRLRFKSQLCHYMAVWLWAASFPFLDPFTSDNKETGQGKFSYSEFLILF